jgi:hypothetical protein
MNHLLRPRNWEPACGTERSGASANYMAVLPGVLGCRSLRRTVKVRLGTNPAVPRDELPGGTSIFVISRQQFMKYPG